MRSSDDFEYRSALPGGSAHRRGAQLNPGNRFEATHLEWTGDEIDRQRFELISEGIDPDTPRKIPLQVFADRSRSAINRVAKESVMPFDWTLNPYRGCEHGCIYCYARHYHEYLGFSCGLDFETKIVAKFDAPQMLKKELANEKWKPEPIVMSAITDVYQGIEHKYRLTRQCLQIMADCLQPVSTMTKSAMVLRDIDLWQKLASKSAGRVCITMVTLDPDLARKLEPRASLPEARLRAIRELTRAGIPVGVGIAPIIPGLTDHEIPAILEAVADAGAKNVFRQILTLPWQIKELFLDWLTRSVHPSRAQKVESLIRQVRDGQLNQSAPQIRGTGTGKHAEQISSVFKLFKRKYHLDGAWPELNGKHFVRPNLSGQLSLWT